MQQNINPMAHTVFRMAFSSTIEILAPAGELLALQLVG
jgi:hypothetical protein